LLVLCATELAFGCFGELGPLDTQIDKPNEIIGADSGLDLFQGLAQITDASFESFEQQMVGIIRHSSGAITTKVAAEIASSLTVGLFSPISAQVDPLRLGIARRATQIGQVYGTRLAGKNVKQGTVEKLVREYPAHGFVIDQEEANELFNTVRGFNEGEIAIFEHIDQVLRIPAPDSDVIVSDLRKDFPNQLTAPENATNVADQGIIGDEDADPNIEQPDDNKDEFSAVGATREGG
jgi:hypothetical protein